MADDPAWYERLWARAKSAVGGDTKTPEQVLAEVRAKTPTPTLWLFGKTQSGKSSIVRELTGADEATVGEGFRPCTLTTRQFAFPSPELPIVTFLDTRGVGDPEYDPTEDLKAFNDDADLILVTAKIADLAQGVVINPLKTVRAANRRRPVVLALTCLHELNPTEQLPAEYPAEFADPAKTLIEHHRKSFDGLVDAVVVIDLTKPEEGYLNPRFGAPQLKQTLISHLPAAYAQVLKQFDSAGVALKDLHLRRAQPIIAAYSSAAAGVAAIPVPLLDLVALPAIQMQMCRHLGQLSNKPGGAEKFMEMAVTGGTGLLIGTAARQLVKLIPVVGSAVAAATAGASTYALGRAYCLYEQKVKDGHLPDEAAIKSIYEQELSTAKSTWEAKS